VYLDFVMKLRRMIKARGFTMQFWGDIIQLHPELVPLLPKDVVVMEWGYERSHPFEERCARIRKAGIPFYVCPGTSSWNSLTGRTRNCLGNLKRAARAGLEYGAIGFLNTDWGDNGHWQYLPFSYLGFAYGAAVSWCLAKNARLSVSEAISRYAFEDVTGNMGRATVRLGSLDQITGELHVTNGTPLACALRAVPLKPVQALSPGASVPNRYPHDLHEVISWIGVEATARTIREIETALRQVSQARIKRQDAGLIRDEFINQAAMVRHACRRVRFVLAWGAGKLTAAARRRALKALLAEARDIMKEHRRLWLARNRVGGLSASLGVFEDTCVKPYRDALRRLGR
jgi:hypothetical protein